MELEDGYCQPQHCGVHHCPRRRNARLIVKSSSELAVGHRKVWIMTGASFSAAWPVIEALKNWGETLPHA